MQEKEKTFVANVTSQVIERHMVRDLDKILSPVAMADLTDEEVLEMTAEPQSVKQQRERLLDKQTKLKKGQVGFRKVAGLVR